jgi:hypothetical protein
MVELPSDLCIKLFIVDVLLPGCVPIVSARIQYENITVILKGFFNLALLRLGNAHFNRASQKYFEQMLVCGNAVWRLNNHIL